MNEWYRSESTVMPEETDLTSSKVYNYVRRNIEEEEREDEEGNIITMYVFEEMKLPKESWSMYLETIQNTANIDYIAMETGIELEV